MTPYIILYSLGYRVDFKKFKIVATGGIYIKALPQEVDIIIDDTINKTTGIFSNTVFVQNLLPEKHSILIKKDGYYDYQKNLDVSEKSVTKLEHVLLFKKNILYSLVTDATTSPFNKITAPETMPLKNVVAYKISGDRIIYLAQDGFLYNSDLQGENTEKLSETALVINKKNAYQILIFNQIIFLKNQNSVLLFEAKTKSFKNFYSPVSDMKLSPDGRQVLYFNDHEILFSPLNPDDLARVFLNRFSEKITDAQWLDDNYIILNLGNKIIISETDTRDTINTIELPQTLTLDSGKTINMAEFPSAGSGQAKISFNQQDKKLYILIGENLIVSEKLIP